jgi:hypothetical protein
MDGAARETEYETVTRRPLRIAVVQIKYIPIHKPVGSSRLLLPQQPERPGL